MTKHEAAFREVHPLASIESQRTNGPAGKRYYLVKKRRSDGMYVASGSTKAQAWRKAAATLPKHAGWTGTVVIDDPLFPGRTVVGAGSAFDAPPVKPAFAIIDRLHP